MKKPIRCPNCDSICIEIKTHGYPKEIHEPNIKKVYNEYRYVCPNCGSEWIHDTLHRLIEEVPTDAQFHFNKDGKLS